ncbi:Replication protein A 70 kDa DNA-binding subunit A [Hibiscus syriacus]|uniref:Replication protein A 70 kDa DNA-binding subunit A n=1 Tax=Hibiscus syriacus TaxID=106335 RepID=A0A6A3B134_HIBSY|nr:Replication protein A 70 kDa DNA-binding subunit A [Hibiscus syriacus]
MPVNLTHNAISMINNGDVNSRRLVQVVDIKLIGNSQERYRFLLSDSESTQHAMLATQLNEKVRSGRVKKGSIIQLIGYICSTVQNRSLFPSTPYNDYTLAEDYCCAQYGDLIPEYEIIGNPKVITGSEPETNKSIPNNNLEPSGRWAIKARVTAKGDLRRYNNARGDGKVFSFDLLDSDGGEIRVTCFNTVVDRFYNVIEVERVGDILELNSTVEPCPDEEFSIPRQQFSFRPISETESSENNSILDVIGIVISVNPSVPILRKNGMETQRRILNLKDASGKSVEVTLWGDFCNKEGQKLQEMVDSGFSPVLAVKAGKVNDFNGKSIGTISSTQLFIEPDGPEAQGLRNWFETGGRNTASISISKEICLEDPKMRQCSKKVTQSGNKRWLCDRCNQEFEECDYRSSPGPDSRAYRTDLGNYFPGIRRRYLGMLGKGNVFVEIRFAE